MTEAKKVPGSLNRATMSIDLSQGYPAKEEGKGQRHFADTLPDPSGEPTVVTSVLPNMGWHAPVLDIDVPHVLVPSSTPGNAHLYLDVAMTWKQYKKLMKVMAEVGIIEPGYYRASVARGFSCVRLPWIKKGD